MLRLVFINGWNFERVFFAKSYLLIKLRVNLSWFYQNSIGWVWILFLRWAVWLSFKAFASFEKAILNLFIWVFVIHEVNSFNFLFAKNRCITDVTTKIQLSCAFKFPVSYSAHHSNSSLSSWRILIKECYLSFLVSYLLTSLVFHLFIWAFDTHSLNKQIWA